MIKFNQANKFYPPQTKALDNLTLNINSGEFVSIVGQSGSGKTTMVKCLIGEERLDSGQIMVGDWNITRLSSSEVPYLRRQIGVIFQDFKLLPKKTLAENVAFALQVCGKSSKKINTIIPQLMKIVGLSEQMDRYPHEVSGGEQQRAAIARALVYQPKILLADEPTGNLDSINAEEIIELLQKINKFGTTVILVTHNREIVNNLNKRVLTVSDGRLVSDQARGKYLI
ncbi:ATP-binding cassette domain-containing protein [Candidatus Falkowbacteria bacterium]|jgi:cell division transport system ATP-binding protein|nr:ATP-binding cassette domain-containing protein [Candidatus Falkowbacteria bacterium]